MKRLIVNADDLGLTPGVNRAILEAHRDGIVTSATCMANGPAWDGALAVIAAAPKLAIGCHIDLIQLSPVLPPEQLPSLTDGTHFHPGFARLAVNAWRGHVRADEIAAEAVAQIRKLQSAGISVSHFDTHKHTHMLPPILKALLRAARECGVSAVRNPFEPDSPSVFRNAFARWRILSRWAAVRSLRTLGVDFRREVERAGLVTTDGTVGIALTGHMDQHMLCDLLQGLPHGTWELVTHPGYAEPGLQALSKLTASREVELGWLRSAETRRAIERAGIQLITYADLTV